MAKFLHGYNLNLAIQDLMNDAKEFLLIVSPYIKLHSRYKDCLKSKIDNHNLKLVILIGKNENDYLKSMPKEEFEFFQQFPNIEIRYKHRLHAKYYANENYSILTSMNLYEFSQDNNLEAGIHLEAGLIENFALKRTLDEQAFNYFRKVSENSDILFSRVPQYEKKIMGLKKKYTGSVVKDNNIEHIIPMKKQKVSSEKLENDGFCIRCGTSITLKPTSPYCKKCYDIWQKYKNNKYKEKYCHICGAETNTTMGKPTCYSCYMLYKDELEFKIQ